MKNFSYLLPIVIVLILFVTIFIPQAKRRSAESQTAQATIPVETQNNVSPTDTNRSLPEGYTLDSYDIEEVNGTSCEENSDCETPVEYLVQSRCPFTSICPENKCTVVCPNQETVEVQGIILAIKREKDGSILTVTSDDTNYEVLVSIPNLGKDFADEISKIDLGRQIRATGIKIKFENTDRIIATQIYLE